MIGIAGIGYVGGAMRDGLLELGRVPVCYDPYKLPDVQMKVLQECRFVFICVPTPPTDDGSCDPKAVDDVLFGLSQLSYRGTAIIKSTLTPREVERMTCRYAQLDIATNPEFLTERNAHKDFLHPAQIVLGTTDKNRQPLVQLYRELFPEVPILAVRPAEAMLIKYGCNCYGAVKVTFFNEIFRLAKAMGMSFDLVREGILGWKRIYADHTKVPGPDGKRGFGGHCFPKDSRALLQEAEHLEVPMAVLRAAVEENDFNRGAAT